MENNQRTFEISPAVSGAALLLIVGYLVASKRWGILRSAGSAVFAQLGSIAVNSAIQSLQQNLSEHRGAAAREAA